MLTKEQKSILTNTVFDKITDMDLPKLHSLKYISETNPNNDHVEIEAWNTMQSINILAFFSELNLVGLIFTNKQNDVYSISHNIKIDIYTFKFI